MRLVVIISLLIGMNTFAQTTKAVYSFKIEKSPVTGSTSLADQANPLAEENEFFLLFDTKYSYYSSEKTESRRPDLSDALAGSYYPVKYNFQERKFEYNAEFDKLYCVKEGNIPEWEVTAETKNISGYECVKAIGKLKNVNNPDKHTIIEAWFAPELPYRTGPNMFVNLPGLVVYAVDRNQYIYKLERIKFNDNNKDLNNIKMKGTVINQQEYADMLNEENEKWK